MGADLESCRKTCESWDEEGGCLDDYPDECPLRTVCKEDAEEEGEEDTS